jgi:Subtilase family
VSLISTKFIGPAGGNVFWAIQALDYFIDLKTRHGLNIVATNNSWNGGGFSQALLDAIVRAANAGILFVAASGNGDIFGNPFNNDVTSRYPSNYNTESVSGYDAVIAVTALTSSGDKASWANYGATTVDLAAPGLGIYSTTPNGTYSSFSGTSMATPHVTGAVALYSALNPGATAAQIRDAILGSTTPTPSVNGISVTNGRLNIGNLMAASTSEPDPLAPPDGLVAAAVAHDQINLTWVDHSTDPAEDGCEIDRCQGSSCTSFTQIATVGANLTSYASTGLAANTTYRYRVRATNAVGDSANSNVAQATTQAITGPPAAPSNLTATPGPAARQITLNWQDNATTESGFRIYRCQGNGCNSFSQIATVGPDVTTFLDSNRTSGRTYRYRVRANNSQGNSSYSNIASATAP